MYKVILFSAFIAGSLFLLACNDLSSSKTFPNTDSNISIGLRSDCVNCLENCCCGIEMLTMGTCTLRVCGTTDGTFGACPEPTGCIGAMASLNSKQIILTAANPKFPFCADELQGMWIANLGPDSGDFQITCRGDETNPPWTPSL